MKRVVTDRVRKAHEELNEVYELEKKERAKLAWSNGVVWVIFKLEEGLSLEEVKILAEEKGVNLYKYPDLKVNNVEETYITSCFGS